MSKQIQTIPFGILTTDIAQANPGLAKLGATRRDRQDYETKVKTLKELSPKNVQEAQVIVAEFVRADALHKKVRDDLEKHIENYANGGILTALDATVSAFGDQEREDKDYAERFSPLEEKYKDVAKLTTVEYGGVLGHVHYPELTLNVNGEYVHIDIQEPNTWFRAELVPKEKRHLIFLKRTGFSVKLQSEM